jgi:hypothetical protein
MRQQNMSIDGRTLTLLTGALVNILERHSNSVSSYYLIKLPSPTLKELAYSLLVEPHSTINTEASHQNLRRTHIITNTGSSHLLRELYAKIYSSKCVGCKEYLPPNAMALMENNGYFTIPDFISQSTCTDYIEQIRNMVFFNYSTEESVPGSLLLDSSGGFAGRFDAVDYEHTPLFKEILANEEIYNLAESYFRSPAYLDNITISLSFPNEHADRKQLSDDAQLFHIDYTNPYFVKFFLFLSDVGAENGPHQYILGSHKDLKTVGDQRLTQSEIESAYGSLKTITHLGDRGMLVMENTTGYHRGMPLLTGYRCMIQIQYSICNFGHLPSYERHSPLNNEHPDPMHKYQYIRLS